MAEFFDIDEFLNLNDYREPKRYHGFHDGFLDTYSDAKSIQIFRLDKASIEDLTEILHQDLSPNSTRGHPLSALAQVLVGLKYYATPGFQADCGQIVTGISQPSVSLTVQNFANAIIRRKENFIAFPVEDAALDAQRGFHEMSGFPGVVGCVDGTHIPIQAPSHNENDYINRKHFHSINAMVVCDYKKRITNIYAAWPGSAHDSFVLRNCSLWDEFEAIGLASVMADSIYKIVHLVNILNSSYPTLMYDLITTQDASYISVKQQIYDAPPQLNAPEKSMRLTIASDCTIKLYIFMQIVRTEVNTEALDSAAKKWFDFLSTPTLTFFQALTAELFTSLTDKVAFEPRGVFKDSMLFECYRAKNCFYYYFKGANGAVFQECAMFNKLVIYVIHKGKKQETSTTAGSGRPKSA